jgi:peptidoglycan glycosyltransferase
VGVVVLLLFAVLAAQDSYLQFWKADALNVHVKNPRTTTATVRLPRGAIYAGDHTLLAESVPSGSPYYPWKRVYPLGSLTSGVVGFNSNFYGAWALEAEYADTLISHRQPPLSWSDLLAPRYASDSIQITLLPALQRVAQTALAGRDGAVVALDPRNGNVLAMYSNPTFDPAGITANDPSHEAGAWHNYNQKNEHGFPPLGLLATQQTFPPGSTSKVVTTAAVFSSAPDLANKSYPSTACLTLPNSNKPLCNDGGSACGGTIYVMLPASCDPGYASVGLDLGGTVLARQANGFGYNATIPIDLPGVATSYFPPGYVLNDNQPFLAYSAIGQGNVRTTALQNALVASAIANHGLLMTPHLLSEVIGPNETVVSRYKGTPWKRPISPSQADQIVPMMRNVVLYGTASGVGFRYGDEVAAKTGTAQTGNALSNTDDWMIAFAPASNPVVAVAVVVPYQAISAYGATVAGPIVKCVIEGALAINAGQPASNTSATCPS